MNRPKTMNAIRNLSKLLLVCIISIFSGIGMFAQVFDANIELRNTVPTNTLNVCGVAETFAMELENVNQDVAVNSFRIKATLPNGMVYQDGSLLVTLADNTAVPFVVNTQNLVDITITPVTPLPYRGIIKIQYTAGAGCSIIPPRQQGQAAQVITVFNTIECTYVIGANNIVFKYNNNSAIHTNSYNLKYADLKLPITSAEQSLKSYRYAVLDRDIPVINASGAGSTDEVRVYIAHDRANLVFNSAQIASCDENKTPLSSFVPITFSANDGTNYQFTVNAAVLTSIGLGTSLDAGEGFIIRENIKVTGIKNTIATSYKAQWGCNGAICNADAVGSANASSIVYIENQKGAPTMSFQYAHIVRSTFCQPVGTIKYTIKNTGIASKDGAYNVVLQSYMRGYQVTRILLSSNNDDNFDIDVTGDPGVYKYSGYYYFNFYSSNLTKNPIAGLSDMDEDGRYDDLAAGNSISFLVEYNVGECPVVNNSTAYCSIYSQWTNNNNEIYASSGQSLYDYAQNYSSSLITPIDIIKGKPQTFGYYAYSDFYEEQIRMKSDIREFYMELEVPEGVVLAANPNARYGSTPITVFQDPVTRTIKLSGGGNKGYYYVDLDLNCTGSLSNKSINLVWKPKLRIRYNNPACECNMQLGSATTVKTFAHFNCDGAQNCITMDPLTAFKVERASFGWKKANHTGRWYKSDLIDANKADRNTSGIDLKNAYVYDDIETTIQGHLDVTNCNVDALHARVSYTSPVTGNFLQFKNLTFVINGEEKYIQPEDIGVRYTVTNITGNDWMYDFFIDQATLGHTFITSDVQVKAKFRIIPLTNMPGTFEINNLRGGLSIIDSGENSGSEHYGYSFTILNPIQSHSYGYGENYIVLNITSFPYVSSNYEFRPSFHFDEIQFEIPPGRQIERVECYNAGYQVLTDYIVEGNVIKIKNNNYSLPEANYLYFYIYYKINCLSQSCNTYNNKCTINRYAYSYFNAYINDNSGSPVPPYVGTVTMYNPIYKPTLSLNLEANQPGIKNKVVWVNRLLISSNASKFTWIAFEPNDVNHANVKLTNIYDNAGKAIPFIRYPDNVNGPNIMVQLGTLSQNTTQEVRLEAEYTNCLDGTIDKVNVFAGWDPQTYPATPQAYPCTPLTGQLTLTHKTANMQWEVKQDNPGPFNLCEDVNYRVTLNSTGLANMYNVKSKLELPAHARLATNVTVKYGSVVKTIPASAGNLFDWDLLALLSLNDGFPGSSTPITLDFGVTTECGFDAGEFVHISASGTTNCNDLIAYDFQERIPILGFNNLDNIRVYVSPVSIPVRGAMATSRLTVSNNNLTTSTPGYIEAVLSPEFAFVPGSTLGLGEPTIITLADGSTALRWVAPTIPARSDFQFTFKVKDQSVCPDNNGTIVASCFMENNISSPCTPDNLLCPTRGTFNKYIRSVQIPLTLPGKPGIPVGPISLCINSGESVYTTSGIAGAIGYEWLLTPADAGIILNNGTSATITWNTLFTGQVQLQVRASDNCGTGDYSNPLTIIISDQPGTPGIIDGAIGICKGESKTYTIEPIANSTSYIWEVPAGSQLISTPTPGTAIIRFDNEMTLQPIRVKGQNEVCGVGISSPDLLVTVNPIPIATFSGFNEDKKYCLNADVVALTPDFAGGAFSGPGITENIFNPTQAGRGSHKILYTIKTNNCMAFTEQIVEVSAPIVNILNLQSHYCVNTPAFQLLGTPNTGGTYVFTINGTSSNPDESPQFNPEVLLKGLNTVKYEFTDAITRCSNSISRNSYIHELPVVTIEAKETLPICAGKQVNLTANIVGIAPYTYTWQPSSAITPNISFTAQNSESYSVIVTDAYKCANTANLQVDVLPAPRISIDASFTKAVSCPGAADGELKFSVAYPNNYDALSFSITPHNLLNTQTYPQSIIAGSTKTFTNMSLGNQVIKVVSQNGCEDSKFEYIRNGGPVITLCAEAVVGSYDKTIASPIYFNGNVKRLRLTASNTFTYTITGKELNYSGTGTYGTDMKIGPLNVYPGEEYTFSITKDGTNTCDVTPYKVRINTANIILTKDEATGKYKQCFVGEAKDVKVTASLNDGCTVFLPSDLKFQLRRKVEGSEPILVTGYNLTNDGNTFTFNDLTEIGDYLVDVQYRDQTTWTKSGEFSIVASSILKVDVTTTDVTCNGLSNGKAEANITGNEAVAIVKWYTLEGGTENIVSTYAVAQGLKAGDYHLYVDDPRGCKTTYSEDVTIKEPISLGTPMIGGLPCKPIATIDPSGGTAPYTFYWYKVVDPYQTIGYASKYLDAIKSASPGSTFDPFETLALVDKTEVLTSAPTEGQIVPGTYRVEVIDANQCKSSMTETKIVEQDKGARTYEFAFRWTTKVKEKNDDEKSFNDNKLPAIGASKSVFQMEKDMYDCVKKTVADVGNLANDICNSAEFLNDKVTLAYDQNNYYYTLYYYDRAGNLTRTIAPEGVKTDGTRETLPDHIFKTDYAYNNLGQLNQQQSPDAGVSQFVYNNKGQLRFSQNAKQAVDGTFSYTKYDELGRVLEVGECKFAGLPAYSYTGGVTGSFTVASLADLQKVADLEDVDFDPTDGLSYQERFPKDDHSANLSQQTISVYSIPEMSVAYNGKSQRNLLNRISQVYTFNKNGDKISTFYSYDIHGNVEWVVQELPVLGRATIAYEYDLISNKVLKVKLNEGRPDAFYHKYSYDEDNRIREAYTSVDGMIWDRDATYAYYDHGPLKNVQLGQDKIQNIQYTYTLNGWLKAINTPDLKPLTADEDKDFASDQFGMVLGYYEGDFSRKEGTGTRFTKVDPHSLDPSKNGTTSRNLYNGNISSWLTSGKTTDGSDGMLKGYQYAYDKLNRIKASDFNIFDNDVKPGGDFIATNLYKETYNYDLNGNITSLTRNGNNTSAIEMDNLVYHYQPGNNKLDHVNDDAAYTDRYDMDVDNQGDANYLYDAIGNLIRDNQAGNSITWNVYGKVDQVIPDKATDPTKQRPHIVYSYDAAGNRIKKQVNYKPDFDGAGKITTLITNPEAVTTTFYIRDASGNTMAVYERNNQKVSDHYEASFTLAEIPLYGSDRLGMYTPSIGNKLAVIPFKAEDFDNVKPDLGKIVASVPGTQTILTASDDGTSAVINRALYNKAGNYYTFTENWYNFAGTITGNMAVAENENSEAQFYVVPSYVNNDNALTVYNNNKDLMVNSDLLIFDPKNQVQVARLLGSTTREYLVFTVGTDEKMYYHKVDMTLNNGLGDFVAKNQVLDNVNADYSGKLLAIEDQVAGNVKLLATRLNGNVLQLVKYEITSTLNGALTPTVLLTIPNSYGAADMKLSSDGKKLLLYNFTAPGVFSRPAEMLVYNLTDNFQMAGNDGNPYTDPATVPVAARVALPEGTRDNSNAEFTANGNTIVFNQIIDISSSSINTINITDGTVNTLLANTSGDISLRSDGRIYISPVGSTNLLAYEADMATSYPLSMATTLTGTMAGKVYKSKSSTNTEQTYARLVGLKQYELKDHLGNVRSVVSDLKEAKNEDGTLENYAKTLAYYNYYPFGMQMPGRYGPANMVGKGGYRYGFNGKEKDDDFGGSTSAVYDYGFRIYDSRIGKFLSVDPLTKEYPWYSPYQFAGNTPIMAIDLDGAEPKVVHGNGPVPYLSEMKHYVGTGATEVVTNAGVKAWNTVAGISNYVYNEFKAPGTNPTLTDIAQQTMDDIGRFDPWQMDNYLKDPDVWSSIGSGIILGGSIKLASKIPLKNVTEKMIIKITSVPIRTPWHIANQSLTKAAISIRKSVEEGATLYKIGTRGKSEAIGSQFWSTENPLIDPVGYAKKYGVPEANIKNADFIMTAKVKKGGNFITREAPAAPGSPANSGGGIEVVTDPSAVIIESYTTIK